MPGASAPGGQADVTRRKADILVDLDRQHQEQFEDEAGRYLDRAARSVEADLASDPSKQAIGPWMRQLDALRGRWVAFPDLASTILPPLK